ncbi:TlpA disulfide reductase family protein [Paenibacillus lemnae]|uniref:TlpA family protein disulfide reductase n=1 Tax=Paenibacillus lemnae TaxID=1330551 RepID=A0A848M440_PAELE|nr:TlpA disulfide reductase family protein [Paenibacillus lemnae]NMO95366.1 TlpA family protein disulfide reductase [Paenibacillus lemnae]
MKRNLIILIVIIVAAAAVIYQQAGDDIQAVFKTDKPLPTETGAKAGLLSPDFTAEGLDGKTYTGGGIRDKALLINFWASWCEPCKQEAPELIMLANKYGEDLDIYGINVTKYDTEKKARAFAEEFNLNYPLMFDRKGEIFEKVFKGQVFPTNVFIDRNGVITDIILGMPEPKEFEKKIKRLISS